MKRLTLYCVEAHSVEIPDDIYARWAAQLPEGMTPENGVKDWSANDILNDFMEEYNVAIESLGEEILEEREFIYTGEVPDGLDEDFYSSHKEEMNV